MNQQNINPEGLNEIQKKLMEDLNLHNLPEEKQIELINKMTEAVLGRILVETLDKLNEEDKDKYQGMIDNESSPEEMDNFLNSRIPGYGEMVKKIIANFVKEMKKEI
jgi:hypothetical protein